MIASMNWKRDDQHDQQERRAKRAAEAVIAQHPVDVIERPFLRRLPADDARSRRVGARFDENVRLRHPTLHSLSGRVRAFDLKPVKGAGAPIGERFFKPLAIQHRDLGLHIERAGHGGVGGGFGAQVEKLSFAAERKLKRFDHRIGEEQQQVEERRQEQEIRDIFCLSKGISPQNRG